MSILKLENLSYSYDGGKTPVITGLSYSFEAGKIYSIVGKSGAGKTTLLSLLSGLSKPTGGNIYLNDKDIKNINKYDYRSKYVGVVFQSFNLLPKLNALENVLLSMDISGMKYPDKKKHAEELLGKVGLNNNEASRRVLKLSGGQQQRVAIARALSYEPKIILADEPTGNLDKDTQGEIMQIFGRLAHEEGKCVILVTHSATVAKASDIIYELKSLSKS